MHLGVYGTAVITVLTAQNPSRVVGIEPVSTDFIEKQLETILEDYPVKYAKTGMLYSRENIKMVSDKVVEHDLSLVVDPVMIAGCGAHTFKGRFCRFNKKISASKYSSYNTKYSGSRKIIRNKYSLH